MKFFYRKYGKGPPLIILHGLFGMSDNWVTFGKALAKEYEVYIPDQRNHGRSPHSKEFDFEIMSNDIIEFISEHKLDKVVLMGHSMGGKVAMITALNHPEIISKLIVLDIGVRTYDLSPEIKKILEVINTIELQKTTNRNEIKKMLSVLISDKRIIELMIKNIIRKENNVFDWKFNVEAISNNLDKILIGIETEKVFQGPSIFISAEKSYYITGEDFYEIFENFPQAQIEVINNAGHWLHVDAAQKLLSLVVTFLRKK